MCFSQGQRCFLLADGVVEVAVERVTASLNQQQQPFEFWRQIEGNGRFQQRQPLKPHAPMLDSAGNIYG